jgi:hypothetical protein
MAWEWDGFMGGLLTNGVRTDGWLLGFLIDMVTMVMVSFSFSFSSVSFFFPLVWLFPLLVHGFY